MLASVLTMLAVTVTMPQYGDLPPDLAMAARAFDQAQVKSDRAALERLLADDYLLSNSAGEHETKADFIRDYTAKGFTFEPFTIERPVQRVWRDGAVLGGIVEAKGMSDGKRYDLRLRFVDIWAKRDGRWQVVFTQADHAK